MCPVILHIYGPFAINAYGVFVVIGLIITLFLARKDPRKTHIITDEQGLSLLTGSIIAGVLGARILFFMLEPERLTNWYDIFAFWEGGLTESGTIIAIIIFCFFYLRYHHIKILPLLDLAGSYAPLMQVFARIGCFFAGCCFGAQTDVPWAIMYTHPQSLAPLYVYIHPTQLYTSLLFLILFFVMRSIRGLLTRPGQQFAIYLMGASCIRFMTDFWRDDRVYYASENTLIKALSSYQWTALMLWIFALIGFLLTLQPKKS